jgi:hypothetical protein
MGRHTHYYRIANFMSQQRRPLTATEVSMATGSAMSIVQQHLHAMRDNELAHICDWVRTPTSNGKWVRLWKYGPGQDAPRPVSTCSKTRRAAASPKPVVAPKPITPRVTKRRLERTLSIPEGAHKTIFAGGVNPWLQPQTAQTVQ